MIADCLFSTHSVFVSEEGIITYTGICLEFIITMLLSLLTEDSFVWSMAVLFIFTTSNSTSPLGLLLGLLLVTRPLILDTWWTNLVLTYQPLTLIGLIIPTITLLVYWVHGLLHLVVDITRKSESRH